MLPSSDRSKDRLFIADPNIRLVSGHYLTYAASIATASRSRGIPCYILGHADINSRLAAAHGIVPTFRSEIWRNATDGDYLSDANLEIINREFFADALSGLERFKLGKGDTVFYPTLTAGQLSGIMDIVDHLAARGIRHEVPVEVQV